MARKATAPVFSRAEAEELVALGEGAGWSWQCPGCGASLGGTSTNPKTVDTTVRTHFKSRKHNTMADAKPDVSLEGDSSTDAKAPRSRPKAAAARPRGKAPNIHQATVSLLHASNFAVSMIAPDDALDGAEIDALAGALVADPWTAGYITKVAGTATHAQLVAVVLQISIVRMARHGMLPAAFNEAMAQAQAQADAPPPPAAMPMPDMTRGYESPNGAGSPAAEFAGVA